MAVLNLFGESDQSQIHLEDLHLKESLIPPKIVDTDIQHLLSGSDINSGFVPPMDDPGVGLALDTGEMEQHPAEEDFQYYNADNIPDFTGKNGTEYEEGEQQYVEENGEYQQTGTESEYIGGEDEDYDELQDYTREDEGEKEVPKYKFLIAGVEDSGKTSTILQWVYYAFAEEKDETTEAHHCKLSFFSQETCLVELHDTGPWDAEYYSDWVAWCDACILVYNITSKSSFDSLDKIKSELQQQRKEATFFGIVGTHNDEEEKRQVSYQELQEKATEWDCPFIEVSSKNGDNIEELVIQLSQLVRKHKILQTPPAKKLPPIPPQASKPALVDRTLLTNATSKKKTPPPVPSKSSKPPPVPSRESKPSAESALPEVTQPPKPENSAPRRQMIVNEILSTEKSYLFSLEFAITNYMIPLKIKSQAKDDVVKSEHIPIIFGNIDEVYKTNLLLLTKLEKLISTDFDLDHTCIGPAFLEIVPKFEVYMTYVSSHKDSILTVNKYVDKVAFLEFSEEVKKKPNGSQLDLPALLITPVQRIPRYRLLLADLLKRTEPTHPDYENLAKALALVSDLAMRVNKEMEKEENYVKICMIQKSLIGGCPALLTATRLYVREGSLVKICRKVPKKRWFWLFNDSLLYGSVVVTQSKKTTKHKTEGGIQLYTFHRLIPFDRGCKVSSINDTVAIKNAFQFMSNDKSFTVFARTYAEKLSWIADINAQLERLRKASKGEDNDGAAPVWVPDKDTSKCQMCNTTFNMIKRRHHCRNCGKVVCGACSSKKRRVAKLKEKEKRVCNFCYDWLGIQEVEKETEEKNKQVDITSFKNVLAHKLNSDAEGNPIRLPEEEEAQPAPVDPSQATVPDAVVAKLSTGPDHHPKSRKSFFQSLRREKPPPKYRSRTLRGGFIPEEKKEPTYIAVGNRQTKANRTRKMSFTESPPKLNRRAQSTYDMQPQRPQITRPKMIRCTTYNVDLGQMMEWNLEEEQGNAVTNQGASSTSNDESTNKDDHIPATGHQSPVDSTITAPRKNSA
eukprot:TRINITY_DN4177_c0_g1_i1.p1 TRINITY_DN4177_c0_g1~~TRINITY_DN4177_c0_g1_i1.p1  ORF type:complete len:1133 (+),score=222.54 TRINITY_DN4177_c0_g1_i1:341-3400(+)